MPPGFARTQLLWSSSVRSSSIWQDAAEGFHVMQPMQNAGVGHAQAWAVELMQ